MARVVGAYDAHNLLGVNLQHFATDAVAGFVYRNLAAIRWVEWHIHIVQATNLRVDGRVEFDDNLFGHHRKCWHVTNTGAKHYLAVLGHILCLDYAHVDFAEEAVA